MTEPYVKVQSEIGPLEKVIIHRPGPEIENMTPENAERALYSDILNLAVAQKEFNELFGILKTTSEVYDVKDLLHDIIQTPYIKIELLKNIWANEYPHAPERREIYDLTDRELIRQLFEGVVSDKKTLTDFLSKQRYLLKPLHNFFFTRDSAIAIGEKVLIGKMANRVREREALIMEAIFNNHPKFKTGVISPGYNESKSPHVTIEGGDVLVVRHDTLLIGVGTRTTSAGVDFIIDEFGRKKHGGIKHILVQELPKKPESFIHLDMVFTILDRDLCMIYEPVILHDHKLQTVHICLEKEEVKFIREEENLLKSLKNIGIDLRPILCGGKDEWIQKREQWHSGANFFALGPGKVVGYGRNVNTIEMLDKAGFSVIAAKDVIQKRIDLNQYNRYVVTIAGSELSRGGGGCRCMTLPVKRKAVEYT